MNAVADLGRPADRLPCSAGLDRPLRLDLRSPRSLGGVFGGREASPRGRAPDSGLRGQARRGPVRSLAFGGASVSVTEPFGAVVSTFATAPGLIGAMTKFAPCLGLAAIAALLVVAPREREEVARTLAASIRNSLGRRQSDDAANSERDDQCFAVMNDR